MHSCFVERRVESIDPACIYTVVHKKRGSTFVIITLENLDGF